MSTPETAAETIDVEALRAELEGELHAPADPSWDEARAAWNLAVDQRPQLVARPAGVGDVIALVAAAARAGMRVSVQGTGHNAAAFTDLDRTLLISTKEMRDVRVDPTTRIARVEAGAIWSEVVAPAAEHGFAALQGSAHDVGVVGYTLGGGVSLLARKFGLASERVRAIEIVTADATLRRVDAETDSELFWALRGGGGNFGVVTAIEIELLEIAQVYAGGLFFPLERAEEVLQAWRRWTETAPEEMTSVGRMLAFPPLPEVPEPLRGNSFAVIEAIHVGTEAEGAELLAELRELGPAMDTMAMVGFEQLLEVHMDPPEPVPYDSDHQLISRLDETAIQRLVAAALPEMGVSLLGVELRHAGGALARREPASGALGAIDGEFIGFAVGMVEGPDSRPPLEKALADVRAALAPFDSGSNYLNFAEHPVAAESIYGAERLARLREIKRRYDAAGIFRGNHPIEPGS